MHRLFDWLAPHHRQRHRFYSLQWHPFDPVEDYLQQANSLPDLERRMRVLLYLR